MTILNLMFWAPDVWTVFPSLLASGFCIVLLFGDGCSTVVDSPSILASAFLTQPFAASEPQGNSLVVGIPKSFAPLGNRIAVSDVPGLPTSSWV